MNYSDDQEEKSESLSVETSAAPPNGESKPIDAPGKDDEEERPKSPPAINRKENEEGKSEASNADETTATVEQPPQINLPRPPQQSLERAVSYKQAVFEKAIRADVVSMSDLRRLGWVNASRRTQTLERKRAEYREAIKQHYDIDDDTRTLQEQETLRQVLGKYEGELVQAPCQ